MTPRLEQTSLFVPAEGASPNGSRPRRPGQRSARALDARGFTTMSHILVQLAEAGLRPLFAEACKTFGDILWCDDLEELFMRSRAREALAVVVDLTDRFAHSTAPTIEGLRYQRPELPIVLWCDRTEAAERGLDAHLRAGVSAVIFRDAGDLERRFLGSLTSARELAFQQLTDQTLYRRVPAGLAPVVRYCLDHAAHHPRPEAVAATVGLTARSLAGHLRRAGLPPLATLMSWSRVLAASYRLEFTAEPVGIIARSLGFSNPASLRSALKRYANDTPNELRESGGFGWVLRCFERYLLKAQRNR
jgi:AraC-like DNA-binding protein